MTRGLLDRSGLAGVLLAAYVASEVAATRSWPNRRLATDRSGSIAIIGALSLLPLVGAAAVAVDVANLYLVQANDQRIADQSALAAAFAYSQASSQNSTVAQNAAATLATLNGAGNATVSATYVDSPAGNGNKAYMVVVTSTVSLSRFGRTLTNQRMLSANVSATAYAEIHGASSCIIALSSSAANNNDGIYSAGGNHITATSCSVGSTGSINAQGGSTITGQAVYTAGSVTTSNGGSVTSSPTTGQVHTNSSAQTDPYASGGVFSRIATVAALTAATMPTMGSAPSGGGALTCSGGTLTVGSGTHSTITASSGCSKIVFTGGSETDVSGYGLTLNTGVTVTFAAGTYKINGFYVQTGTSTFTVSGTPSFYIWNGINLSGSAALTVNGTATYYVQNGIINDSSKALVINNTSGSNSTFYVSGGIDNETTGSSTFPNGSYTIANSNGDGVAIASNSTMTFGNGTYSISGAYGGISLASSATLTIGSQLVSGSVFKITNSGSGDAIGMGGGSASFTIGSFTNFDINGTVDITGNASLGAGTYTVNGAFTACSNGGNSITATSVSIVAAGQVCFGQGYSSVTLTAPTSLTNDTEGSASTIALATESTAQTTFWGGTSGTQLVGTVYLPNSQLAVEGAANLSGNGSCLQVIANTINVSSGGGITTSCSALSTAGGSGSIALVQ